MEITEKFKNEVLQHAKEVYPKECCGLGAIVKGKLRYFKCKNIVSNPTTDFVIDPEDYAKTSDLGEIVVICHSHPSTAPNPSGSDLRSIELSKLPWLIVNPITEEYTITEPSAYKLPLIGREFNHGVVDCFSLVSDYYRYELGIELKEPYREDNWWLKGQDLYRDNFEEWGFVKVGGSEFKDIKKNDAIIMQIASSVPNHAAVYIGDNMIMQHCQGRLSSRDIYGGYWRKVTNMVLRYKDFL